MSKSRGFTLVELLVTISIISILSAIGLVVYSSVIKQGRDSKRQSDLRSLQSALEQYYADQLFYPYGGNIYAPGLDTRLGESPPPAFTSSTSNPSPPSPAKIYMNSLPQDPIRATGAIRYKYESKPDSPACDNSTTKKCTNYCLYAKLENPPSPLPSPPAGCSYPPGDYNFALTQP